MEENVEGFSKEKISKIKFHVVAIICIILFAIAIAPKTLQNDTFYTVKIGEYISQNGISNLTEDPFSWIDLPYTFPHWLYDFMMFKIYNLFNWDGIYVSTIVFAATLGFAIYMLCNKLSKNTIISFLGAMLAMFCLKPYITARAQLVTFILFVFTVFFIEKFLETSKKRYALILLIIPILIANLHVAVWPFYFVIYLPYIAEYILSLQILNFDFILRLKKVFWKIINKIKKIENLDEKLNSLDEKIKDNKEKRECYFNNPYKVKIEKNKNYKWLLLIFVVCIFTGLLTPLDPSTPYTYLYKTMIGNTTSVINEHLPLTLVNNKECVVFLVITLFLLIFTDTKIRAKNVFFLIGLIVLTFMTRRQFSMLCLIGIPIVTELFSDLLDNHIPSSKMKLLYTFSNAVGAVFIICVVFLIGSRYYKEKSDDAYITNSYPIAASNWILNNLDLENIRLFNEYNYGSYLLYRGIPVMIDSRCDLYTPEYNTKTGDPKDGTDIFMDVQKVCTISISYEKIFEKYDITHVISYTNSKLSMLLRKDDNYKILYRDDNFTVYERNV